MVLAPDLRSHGRSPTAAEHGLETMADDVALLGDGWDLVVGHSMGGALAAVLLARPLGIRAAVLVDPVLRLSSAQRKRLRSGLESPSGPVDAATVRAAEPEWDERDVQRRVLEANLVTPDVVETVLDHNDPWDVTDVVPRWSARVHLLAADPGEGGLLDPRLAQRLAAGSAGGRVTAEVLTGCGHSIHRQRPRVLSAAIAGVLGAPDPA